MKSILIVDDEKHMRLILSKILSDAGYRTFQAENGHKAIMEVKKNVPDLVLLDYKLPDFNGDVVLERIKKIDRSIIVIMLTAYGDIKRAVKSMKLGAYDYLTKPFDNEEILMVIDKAIKNLSLQEEVKTLKAEIHSHKVNEQVIGESPVMQKVMEQVDLVASNDITVFLEGETGTGKDLIARVIHEKSHRSRFPFVAVDCGAIPENLFESEVFGHEKGSFTGAGSTHIGKFEQANGGTLFLDEIGNLPANMQAKFLRILQDKKINRVGSKRAIDVDVRIISASNSDIVQDVEDDKFRKDLFYRIHEFKIFLPGLSDRKEDIPLLADHFIKEFSADFNKKIDGFSINAMNSLINHTWNGNVREMKNVLKRALLLTNSNHIEEKHLMFTNIGFSNKNSLKNHKVTSFQDVTLDALKAKTEVIRKAIEEVGGNKTKAAKKLGITRNQLYRTLNQYENKAD